MTPARDRRVLEDSQRAQGGLLGKTLYGEKLLLLVAALLQEALLRMREALGEEGVPGGALQPPQGAMEDDQLLALPLLEIGPGHGADEEERRRLRDRGTGRERFRGRHAELRVGVLQERPEAFDGDLRLDGNDAHRLRPDPRLRVAQGGSGKLGTWPHLLHGPELRQDPERGAGGTAVE